MKISDGGRGAVPSEGQTAEAERGSHRAEAFLLAALVLLAAFVLAVPYVPVVVKDTSDVLSQLASSLNRAIGTSDMEKLNYTIYSPLILNGTANVSYPPDYGNLSAYVLGLVNNDRANYSYSLAQSLWGTAVSPSNTQTRCSDMATSVTTTLRASSRTCGIRFSEEGAQSRRT